jgi:hypothetical protein
MTTDHLKLTVADFIVLCYRDADLEYVSTENLFLDANLLNPFLHDI